MVQEYTGKKKVIMLVVVAILSTLAFTLLSVVTYFVVHAVVPQNPDAPRPEFGNFSKAAVASNGYLCAKIGKDVLEENGTAVDAAIATMLCEGILCFQSTGLGGGFLMTIYDRKSGKVEVLNARETAPSKAFENMYNEKTRSLSGGMAVAVPGALKGYYEAYVKYGGGVSWKRLFEPSIKICNEGFRVQKYLSETIEIYRQDIFQSPSLREMLSNPKVANFPDVGDVMKFPNLCQFLETTAEEGIVPFYEGRIAKKIAAEVQEEGGILSEDDLKNYKVQWMEPVEIKWGPYKMYSSPVPGSGELLAFMMNILRDFVPPVDETVAAQRFVEAFKWGYARRTELGDIRKENYVLDVAYIKELIKNLTSASYATDIRKKIKDDQTSQDPKYYGAKTVMSDDHGASHISVMSANGDAVSVTSTINLAFGAKFTSKSTGILFNNEMSDFFSPNFQNPFGVPPSPSNFIRPGKRPVSSMCPTIFLNENNEVALVIGASGGPVITSTVAYVAYHTLAGNKTVKEAIDLPKIHHQLFPMKVYYENGYPKEAISRLQEIGHNTTHVPVWSSAVTAIGKLNGVLTASCDCRRGGSVDGY